jgi:hypothetical protein
MTGLHRTPLTTSQKVDCAAQALAGQEAHGTLSELSRQFGVSRPTLYQAREVAGAVLTQHFARDEAEHQAVRVTVDEAQLRRTIVALRVMAPNAIRPIEELLPILYPGVRISYGKVQSILAQAEDAAGRFNKTVELSAITVGALDEMFSQGEPVLGGVDLDSGYLFALQLCATRSGQDWADVLNQSKAQGVELSVVVKDAAKGIEAGVREVFPDAEQRDDCFHVLYAMNKLRRRLEQRAYGAITAEQEAEQALRKIRARDKDKRREHKRKLEGARQRCQRAIERFDVFDAALKQVREALEYVDLDRAQLRTGEQVQSLMEQAAQSIAGIDDRDCAKLARYVHNRAPGVALASTALHTKLQQLSTAYPEHAVAMACLFWRLRSQLQPSTPSWSKPERRRLFLGALSWLKTQIDDRTLDELLDTIKALLEKRHRASSAIEGFNAALRPYLYVHKGVTHNFLELFRAWYNLRTRRWGRHKGTSAHACVTGTPVEDWLTLLGYPPSASRH